MDGGDDRRQGAAPTPLGGGAFTLRALLFGLIATVVLTVPEALGLSLAPWRGVDGAVVLLLLAGVGCFGWPPPTRSTLARSSLDLSVATASVALFGVLAASTASAAAAESEPAAAAVAGVALGGVSAALVLLGRLGGWAGAAAALAFAGAVGLLGAGGPQQPSSLASGLAVEVLPMVLDLEGPLRSGQLRIGDAPPVEVRADLVEGASRRLHAWIPAPVDRAPGAVSAEIDGVQPPGPDGRIRAEVGPAWVPPTTLAGRQRPPVPLGSRPAPPSAGLLLAWGSLLCLLGVRARSRALRPLLGAAQGAALGLLLALGLARLVVPSAGLGEPAVLGERAPGVPHVRCLEGAVGAETWLQVDRVRQRLVIEGLGPRAASIQLWGAGLRRCLLDATVSRGRFEMVLGEGVVADLVRPLDVGLRVLRPAINGWGNMDSAWVREGPAGWRRIGSWGMGDRGDLAPHEGGVGRLPEPAAGPEGPQGSLGRPPAWAHGGADGADWMILGRLSEGAFGGLVGPRTRSGRAGDSPGPSPGPSSASSHASSHASSDARGPEVWLRLTGAAPSRER